MAPIRALSAVDRVARIRAMQIVAALAGILAQKQISLEAVLQQPCDTKHDLPFVITVEPTTERSIFEAVREMEGLDFLRESPVVLPMEPPL